MKLNLTQKLIQKHLLKGKMQAGEEIGIKIDQTLTQDATGTLVMLELEAMELDRVKTELSVQYVDHNIIQEDFKNPDDHLFLLSACQKFGVWYSRPGNGVSHPLHQERFGIPGRTLLGSDSHTCAAGAIGMLAIGAGGLEVALAMAGEPFYLKMPEIWGVELKGRLPDWVSAKDIILEMLRRHGVSGGVGKIVEYYGPGLENLSAMDRHVIANMGAELGATTTVFPSDDHTRVFFESQDRGQDWHSLGPDEGCNYDLKDRIQLDGLVPLIALPTSPGNVKPVSEVAGEEVFQCYIGSSANPGYRDFAVAAEIVKGKQVHSRVSLDINPSSRQILENITQDGYLQALIHAGARIHQAGCNGCIGMGQAPATDKISLRTVPRNFPGRSGTPEDKVYLVSPETAAASALRGVITDPRDLDGPYPKIKDPLHPLLNADMFLKPLEKGKAQAINLVKGPNIATLPDLDPVSEENVVSVLLKMADDISTDEILPAGARVLPFRSNIPKISEFAFEGIDASYPKKAAELREKGGHAIVAGENYGQGSSREHAALAPRYLGLRLVLAKSYSRIHWQNLINFGILPLKFINSTDYDEIQKGDKLSWENLISQLKNGNEIQIKNQTQGKTLRLKSELSKRQQELILLGGLINWMKKRLKKN